MFRSADAKSGIVSLPALFIVGIVAALCWLIPWMLFADLGGWPSNDDPFYAKPLALWAEHGEWHWVRQNGALSASSVAHVAAGFLTMAGDDFSYRSLYLVCIFQQALGIVVLFWFSRRLELPLGFALGIAATLATFPIYYGQAFTFMTDGPAAAWSAIACTTGIWGILKRDWRWLLASSLAIGWGYWIRQTNVLTFAVPLAALWLVKISPAESGRQAKDRLLLSLSLIAPAAIAIAAFEWGGWMPGSITRVKDVVPGFERNYWHQAAVGAYGWLLICGWFGLPWLWALLTEAKNAARDLSPNARRACHFGAALVGFVALLPFLATGGRAALTSATGNCIQNGHFGPIFTSDMDEPGRWGSLNGVEWPFGIWQSLSLLSIVTVAAMAWWGLWTVCQALSHLSRRGAGQDGSETIEGDSRDDPSPQQNQDAMVFGALACLAALVVASCAITFFVEPHMDRYWLFLLPIVCVWWMLLASLRRWRLGAPALLWAGMWFIGHLSMSVVFTHDLLAWNNARWTWIQSRMDDGLKAWELDGGRDVNAWLRLDEDVNTAPRPGDTSAWWSGFATWAVAVGPRPGWQIAERLPWHSWATGKTHELLILNRIANDPPRGSPGPGGTP